MIAHRTLPRSTLSALSLMLCVLTASAHDFPERPIRLITGGAPGSPTDLVARPLAESLSKALGQPVVVENRTGAGGIVAMDLLAKAPADGYTLGVASTSQLVFNSYLFSNLPYDPLRDLVPVALLVSGPVALAAHPSFSCNSLTDLIALAKARPGGIDYAVPQIGSPPHVMALLVAHSAGIHMNVVPFRSASDAVKSVLAGDVPIIFLAPSLVAPMVHAGKLKALAVIGFDRIAALADTPTAAESGFQETRVEAWIGLVAPARTPAQVIQRINLEVEKAIRSPDLKRYYEGGGYRILGGSSEAFSSRVSNEHGLWRSVIRDSGLKLD